MVASSPSSSAPPPASVALIDLRPAGGGSGRSSRGRMPPASVATLPDPCTDEHRQYLLVRDGSGGKGALLYELNALSSGRKHSSYFVGSRVVSDGSLSVGTAVDPLFFVLARAERKAGGEEEKKWKWQPLDQALDELSVPRAVRSALLQSGADGGVGGGGGDGGEGCPHPQLRNLFDVTDQFGDDLLLYKFSEDRALRWLEAKHGRAATAARAAALKAKGREAGARKYREESRGGTGAFSAGFVAGDDAGGRDDDENEEEKKAEEDASGSDGDVGLTEEEERAARAAALQFVCGYLGDGWRAKLAERVGMGADDLLGEREKRRRAQAERRRKAKNDEETLSAAVAGNGGVTGGGTQPGVDGEKKKRKLEERVSLSESDRLMEYTMGADGAGGADTVKAKEEEAKKAKLGGAKTVGLKRLAKVNTKGMKSLASFFGGGGAKKKAKKQ